MEFCPIPLLKITSSSGLPSSAGAFGLFYAHLLTCWLFLLCFDFCTFALLFLIGRVLIHGGEVWRTGRQDTLAHLHDKEV